jgi:hypothetical protein
MAGECLPVGSCFTDLVKREPTDTLTEECPKCKGHGMWVLREDAYGDGVHFYGGCGVCWGYGYVTPGQCPHEWEVGVAVSNCMHEWTCVKCATTRVVDSSG